MSCSARLTHRTELAAFLGCTHRRTVFRRLSVTDLEGPHLFDCFGRQAAAYSGHYQPGNVLGRLLAATIRGADLFPRLRRWVGRALAPICHVGKWAAINVSADRGDQCALILEGHCLGQALVKDHNREITSRATQYFGQVPVGMVTRVPGVAKGPATAPLANVARLSVPGTEKTVNVKSTVHLNLGDHRSRTFQLLLALHREHVRRQLP